MEPEENLLTQRMAMQRVTPNRARDDFAEIILYDLHASTIYNYIFRRVGQPQDTEDLLLEVFTAAFKYDNLAGLSEQQQLAECGTAAHYRSVSS
jgi:DNA-directed RNA polymerase specialized sigma24 family protein